MLDHPLVCMVRKNIMADAILDFEFKGHFIGHPGKQTLWGIL
jgi:hypothetical protein